MEHTPPDTASTREEVGAKDGSTIACLSRKPIFEGHQASQDQEGVEEGVDRVEDEAEALPESRPLSNEVVDGHRA